MFYRDTLSFTLAAGKWAKRTGILPYGYKGKPPLDVRFMYGDYLMTLSDQGARFDA